MHQALVFVASSLGESKLSLKQRSLPIEDFKIGSDASPIAHQRRVDGILQILDGCLLRDANLMKFLITNQSIGNIAERQLDDLLVSNQLLPLLRLSQPQIPAESSPVKMGWVT